MDAPMDDGKGARANELSSSSNNGSSSNNNSNNMAGQMPLPDPNNPLPNTSLPNDHPSDESVEMQRNQSQGSKSNSNQSEDNASVNGAAGKTGRSKKKTQRFYCTDFPPCNLNFTRSEHLARHIRKHTGERPFVCHCQRRFSRLDNLRQHAQTVHMHEDIPLDSLAAIGTRYHRQVRATA